MAKEIFSIAAVFWILIPIGLVGGALLLKFAGVFQSKTMKFQLSFSMDLGQVENIGGTI